jgi:hypothetical protein
MARTCVSHSIESSAGRSVDLSLGGLRGGFSELAGVAYLALAHGRRTSLREQEHSMAKQFFWGMFITLAFVALVAAGLLGIFTLVSYLAGPVGG